MTLLPRPCWSGSSCWHCCWDKSGEKTLCHNSFYSHIRRPTIDRLAPRRAITGEVLAPQLPNVAGALGRGDIGEEHVRIIRSFVDRLPVVVDGPTREAAEQQLADMAARFDPNNCAWVLNA